MNKILSHFKQFPDDFVFSQYEWQYRQLIGQGSFGKIYKVKHKSENRFDAIKMLQLKYFDQQFKMNALKSQIKIMQKIKCQNVVQIKDSFLGKNYAYIVLQLCDTDLRKQMIKNNGRIPQARCSQIFNQMSKGFARMVKKQYIHRDIKPQNILIKGNVLKIADFGFTKKINFKQKQQIDEVCGTPLYMAPQLIFNEKYTQKCDIWSLGLMLYEMIFGFNPWPTRHPQVYKNSIKMKPLAFPYDARIGKNTYDFLKRCLQVSEKNRLSWQDFFNHPFVKEKNIGKPINFPIVNEKLQRVLKGFQQCVQRRNLNVLSCFQKYSKKMLTKSMDKSYFTYFLQQIDPLTTTFESEQLFKLIDKNNRNKIQFQQFYEIFCQIDYRPADDIVSRRIQQIIIVAQTRNISMKQLFKMFDKNNSCTIDRSQFDQLIRKVLPKIESFEINQLWSRFDSNKSNYIQKDEFIAQMTRNCSIQLTQSIQRGKRNIIFLHQYLQANKISLKTFFKAADRNSDNKLSIQEFGNLIQNINYTISKKQVIQMFILLDINKDQFLEIEQIERRVKDFTTIRSKP